MKPIDLLKLYSYADYYSWTDDVRRELIDGHIHVLESFPGLVHQIVSGNLSFVFWNYRKQKAFKVFLAPIDVRLPKDNEKADDKIFTVVQPDIIVVCDPSKLDERGCLGAPDLAIEIVSPGSAKMDVKEKFNLYERSGIREYWIVFPGEKIVEVYFLNEIGKYALIDKYVDDEIVPVNVFNGELKVDLKEIFE
jgi:Uma2 family endonuclease